MSDELIALVRSGYEALNRRDFDVWMQQIDPQVEVYELAEAPEPVVYRGPEGVRRWLEQQDEVFEEFSIEPTEIVVSGDVVLATVVLHGRGRGSSAPVTIKLFHVLTIRDGRVLRVRGFLNEADARHAAAADESDKPGGAASARDPQLRNTDRNRLPRPGLAGPSKRNPERWKCDRRRGQ